MEIGLIISIAIFIAVILFMVGIILFIRGRLDPESVRVRKKLKELSTGADASQAVHVDVRRKIVPLSEVAWLDKVLQSIPLLDKIDRTLKQSGLRYPLGVFFLSSIILALIGFFAISTMAKSNLIALVIAVALSTIPFFYISMKKNARMKRFERQLPDALDLIARAVKAGHAFSGGLQMVGQEFNDPIGGEFSRVLEEINFGVGIKEALVSLTERVDCMNLKFFVVAITIQLETGGNLAEILENSASLIRERFKLQGRIRTLCAEGKLSAIILIAIPFFVGISLSIMNPKYIGVLLTDPIGKMLIAASLFMMFIGVLAMKKIIAIKV